MRAVVLREAGRPAAVEELTLPRPALTFPALSLMADGKTMRCSVYGTGDPARDIPALAQLACRGRLDLEALMTR